MITTKGFRSSPIYYKRILSPKVFAVHLVPKKVFILKKGELKPSERTKPVQFHIDVNIKQVIIQPYECNTQPYAQTSLDFRNLNRWGFTPSRGG